MDYNAVFHHLETQGIIDRYATMYFWNNAAPSLLPKPQHHCMPPTYGLLMMYTPAARPACRLILERRLVQNAITN